MSWAKGRNRNMSYNFFPIKLRKRFLSSINLRNNEKEYHIALLNYETSNDKDVEISHDEIWPDGEGAE